MEPNALSIVLSNKDLFSQIFRKIRFTARVRYRLVCKQWYKYVSAVHISRVVTRDKYTWLMMGGIDPGSVRTLELEDLPDVPFRKLYPGVESLILSPYLCYNKDFRVYGVKKVTFIPHNAIEGEFWSALTTDASTIHVSTEDVYVELEVKNNPSVYIDGDMEFKVYGDTRRIKASDCISLELVDGVHRKVILKNVENFTGNADHVIKRK